MKKLLKFIILDFKQTRRNYIKRKHRDENIIYIVIVILLLLIALSSNLFALEEKYVANVEGIEKEKVIDILEDIRWVFELQTKKDVAMSYILHSNRKTITKKCFLETIRPIINNAEQWDRKEIYIWKNGNNEYPEPIIYDEIVETEEKYIIYQNNSSFVIFKKYIDAIKYKNYYKELLIYEEFENKKYNKDNNNIPIDINMLKK